jgi:hypothetical protein
LNVGLRQGDYITGVEIALKSMQSDAEEVAGVQLAAKVSRAGPTGSAAADFSRPDPTCPTKLKANSSEVLAFQKPSNRNFLIVVYDFEEDIAKDRTKPRTIRKKSLNPKQQHDCHTILRREKMRTKLSRDPKTPSTNTSEN